MKNWHDYFKDAKKERQKVLDEFDNYLSRVDNAVRWFATQNLVNTDVIGQRVLYKGIPCVISNIYFSGYPMFKTELELKPVITSASETGPVIIDFTQMPE